MEVNKTIRDYETLTEGSKRIKEIQEKMTSMSSEEKNQCIEQYMQMQNEFNQAEVRMTKRIKDVVVLNEFEKARRESFIGPMIKFIELVGFDDIISDIYDRVVETAESVDDKFSNSFFSFIIKMQLIGAIIIVSAPIGISAFVGLSGINIVKLLYLINSNRKLKSELQACGIYDEIMKYINRNGITPDDYDKDYFVEKFVSEKISRGVR